MHTLSPMTLHGGVLASDGRALAVAGHPLYVDANVVTSTTGETTIELVVPTGSEAARILSVAANLASTD